MVGMLIISSLKSLIFFVLSEIQDGHHRGTVLT